MVKARSDAWTTTFIKTTGPEIVCVVRREALFARLDGLPSRIAGWISGPAGAGKSTLAASYLAARNVQSAWYQVDADDADIATFFHYLSHAVRRIAAGPLPAFDTRFADNVAGFSRHFFRQLFARAAAPAALVLDGLPPLSPDTLLGAALEAGLPQVPRPCCILVTSRSEPPASLARMRATGELVCLGADDLRIQPEELAAIASLRGKPLSLETAQRIQERTQGWAAGVVLMLEHAKIAGRVAELPCRSGGHDPGVPRRHRRHGARIRRPGQPGSLDRRTRRPVPRAPRRRADGARNPHPRPAPARPQPSRPPRLARPCRRSAGRRPQPADLAATTALARAMAAVLRGDFAAAQTIVGGIAATDPIAHIGFALAAGMHQLLDGDYAKARQTAQRGAAMAESEGIHI